MNTIGRLMRLLTAILEAFTAACFFVIFFMTVLLVVLRYVFNSSIMGGNELIEYLFIYTSAIGAAVALAKGEHIRIGYFVERLPPGARRMLEAAGFLLVALFNAAVIYYSLPWIHAVGGFQSPVLRLPNRSIQLIIPIASGLAILYCLCRILLAFGRRLGAAGEAAE